MEYLTVKEICEKWEVSERFVQQRCIEGRIEGARKFNKSWMIPATAERPSDMRTRKAKAKAKVNTQSDETVNIAPSYSYTPMPLMNTSFAPGGMRDVAESIKNEDEKNIALAEYYYYTGNAKEAVHYANKYLESEIMELRLSALFIYAFANLSLDKTAETKKAFDKTFEIYRSMDKDTPPIQRAFAVVLCGSMDTLLHLPRSLELPELQDYIPILPPGLRLFATYVQARYGYLNGLHGTAIGICETALVLVEAVNPIPEIFAHLMSAVCYMQTQYPQMAKRHLMQAWEKAKPDGMTEAFGELHGELWGMLEAVIKKTEPEAFRSMIGVSKYFANGWRKLHNELTGDTIPTDLTPTEFTVAMLVSRGWIHKEIAAHLGTTEDNVKKLANVATQKVSLEGKTDISQIMIPKHTHRR